MFDIQARVRLGGSAGADLQLTVISAILTDLVGDLVAGAPLATGRFNGCKLATFSNGVVVTEQTLIGDLTESAYPGYAESAALVWSVAGVDDAGNHVVVADAPTPFHVTGDPAGEMLHGVYLVSGAGALLAGGTFGAPVPLVNGELIPATAILQVGNL